jgi:predicted RNA-binding Zn-ribbon protein involved in translation (DUF1610 family)
MARNCQGNEGEVMSDTRICPRCEKRIKNYYVEVPADFCGKTSITKTSERDLQKCGLELPGDDPLHFSNAAFFCPECYYLFGSIEALCLKKREE